MQYTNKAVYTALVAPSMPKSESITHGRTDERTDGWTDGRTSALIVASERLKSYYFHGLFSWERDQKHIGKLYNIKYIDTLIRETRPYTRHKTLLVGRKAKALPTFGRTDRWTDRWTDNPSYRVIPDIPNCSKSTWIVDSQSNGWMVHWSVHPVVGLYVGPSIPMLVPPFVSPWVMLWQRKRENLYF